MGGAAQARDGETLFATLNSCFVEGVIGDAPHDDHERAARVLYRIF